MLATVCVTHGKNQYVKFEARVVVVQQFGLVFIQQVEDNSFFLKGTEFMFSLICTISATTSSLRLAITMFLLDLQIVCKLNRLTFKVYGHVC